MQRLSGSEGESSAAMDEAWGGMEIFGAEQKKNFRRIVIHFA
jgi:hypothetical protein